MQVRLLILALLTSSNLVMCSNLGKSCSIRRSIPSYKLDDYRWPSSDLQLEEESFSSAIIVLADVLTSGGKKIDGQIITPLVLHEHLKSKNIFSTDSLERFLSEGQSRVELGIQLYRLRPDLAAVKEDICNDRLVFLKLKNNQGGAPHWILATKFNELLGTTLSTIFTGVNSEGKSLTYDYSRVDSCLTYVFS